MICLKKILTLVYIVNLPVYSSQIQFFWCTRIIFLKARWGLAFKDKFYAKQCDNKNRKKLFPEYTTGKVYLCPFPVPLLQMRPTPSFKITHPKLHVIFFLKPKILFNWLEPGLRIHIKGSVSRDFRPPVFFMIQNHLGPW